MIYIICFVKGAKLNHTTNMTIKNIIRNKNKLFQKYSSIFVQEKEGRSNIHKKKNHLYSVCIVVVQGFVSILKYELNI